MGWLVAKTRWEIAEYQVMTHRRRRTKRPFRYAWIVKKVFVYVVLFLVVLGFAALPLAKGRLFYQSYWGGAVFVPVILGITVLIVVVAVRDIRAEWRKRHPQA